MRQRKIYKSNKFILLLYLIFIAYIAKAQTTEFYHIPCRTDSIQIRVPIECMISKYNDDESHYTIFTFSDSSCIVLHCGTLVRVPMLGEKQEIEHCNRGDFISHYGVERDKYCWREDDYYGYHIYYINVLIAKRKAFDEILDSLILISYKKKG